MMAAMDEKNTIWIKHEEVDDMPTDPHSMSVEDPMGLSYPTDFINQEPEVILKVEDTENIRCSVAAMEEQETSISIKEEEIVEECNEPDSESFRLSAMDNKTTLWIKEEAADDVPEPGTTSYRLPAMDNATTIWIKEEAADDVPEPGITVLEDPLKIDELSQVKQELELKVHTDGSEQKFLDDPLGVYWSTDHINEDSRPNLGWDENENNNAVVNTLLHTILEAESECCPPPLLLPKKELFPDDTLGIPCLTDFIKEDPELNLEADEPETIVSIDTSDLLHVE